MFRLGDLTGEVHGSTLFWTESSVDDPIVVCHCYWKTTDMRSLLGLFPALYSVCYVKLHEGCPEHGAALIGGVPSRE